MATFGLGQTTTQLAVLQQIAQRESTNNPTALGPMTSSGQATGLYQITDGTWAWVAAQTGVGGQYSQAAQAPVSDQTTNALWLLNRYGPNATITWAASAPPGGYPDPNAISTVSDGTGPIVDLTGPAANQSTASILDQLGTAATDVTSGIDLSSPTTGIVLAVAGAAAAYLLLR